MWAVVHFPLKDTKVVSESLNSQIPRVSDCNRDLKKNYWWLSGSKLLQTGLDLEGLLSTPHNCICQGYYNYPFPNVVKPLCRLFWHNPLPWTCAFSEGTTLWYCLTGDQRKTQVTLLLIATCHILNASEYILGDFLASAGLSGTCRLHL